MSGAPQSQFSFRRSALAADLADSLMGRGAFNYASGLFLAAPRRTGKSTFMREDLMPTLTARQVLPTYVDLWSDRKRDPASLIADALRSTLQGLDSWGGKKIRKSGLTKLSVGGALTFDVEKIGQPDGTTLTDVFKAIVQRTGHPAALIVDEAQQALTTEAGMDTMFALKAARDALNQGTDLAGTGGLSLLLIFTGSHRDKLTNFVLKREQPFFGADIIDFPRLGRDYADAYTVWLNARLAEDNRFDQDDVWRAFTILGHRPELLQRVLKDAALGATRAASLKADLADGAHALRERIWEDYDSEFSALTPLQAAVLGHLIRMRDKFMPFTAFSMSAYAEELGRPVSAAEAQTALDALRQKNLVWRNARAAYALEDQDMADWFQARYRKGMSQTNPT